MYHFSLRHQYDLLSGQHDGVASVTRERQRREGVARRDEEEGALGEEEIQNDEIYVMEIEGERRALLGSEVRHLATEEGLRREDL